MTAFGYFWMYCYFVLLTHITHVTTKQVQNGVDWRVSEKVIVKGAQNERTAFHFSILSRFCA